MLLLNEDVLVFQQVTAMMTNNFAIHDAAGAVVGNVETHGSLGSLLVKGSRHFTVSDADGQPVVVLRDPLNFVRDTFELENPDGSSLGQIRKRFTFFGQRLGITLDSGELIELKGNLPGLNFDLRMQGNIVARVSRRWSGVARGLLGRSTYSLTFEPVVPAEIRKATIAAMIALDLVRHKENNS